MLQQAAEQWPEKNFKLNTQAWAAWGPELLWPLRVPKLAQVNRQQSCALQGRRSVPGDI